MPTQPPPSSADGLACVRGSNEIPGLGRSMAISSAISVSVAFALVGIGMVLAGVSYPMAASVALFAAAWGGGGFGAMIGGVLHAHRVPVPVLVEDPAVSRFGPRRDANAQQLAPWPLSTRLPGTR